MTKETIEQLKQKVSPQMAKILAIGFGVLVLVLLVRSCSGEKQVTVVQTTAAEQKKPDSKNFDGTVDLAAKKVAGRDVDSFAGFKFGTSADEFMNVKPVTEEKIGYDGKDTTRALQTNYWTAIVSFNKIRLFDLAELQFTAKDKRLCKVTLQTSSESLQGLVPSSILQESLYCAEIIEEKYQAKFSLSRETRLYSEHGEYDKYNKFSSYKISPSSAFHGFFCGNMIEVKCVYDTYKITISATDHRVIEQDGGRTKKIKLDADDDASKF